MNTHLAKNYSIERLADKSAFVVFEHNTYKTFVVQQSFLTDCLIDENKVSSISEFEKLSKEQQINLFLHSSITSQLV